MHTTPVTRPDAAAVFDEPPGPRLDAWVALVIMGDAGVRLNAGGGRLWGALRDPTPEETRQFAFRAVTDRADEPVMPDRDGRECHPVAEYSDDVRKAFWAVDRVCGDASDSRREWQLVRAADGSVAFGLGVPGVDRAFYAGPPCATPAEAVCKALLIDALRAPAPEAAS